MTAQWALDLIGHVDDLPLQTVAAEVTLRFASGSASPAEVPRLRTFAEALARGTPMDLLEPELRGLSHDGYLRGALVVMAAAVERSLRADVALAIARELIDAIDPDLGIRMARAVLALPAVDERRHEPGSTFVAANRLLGEAMLERDDPQAGLRHFEAVLSVDVHDRRALRGWSTATRMLERRGIAVDVRSRGLALLEGLEAVELSGGVAGERYELGRPLGRGRHAVVYEAFDRKVGRDVALKRLLDPDARRSDASGKVIEARFFSEARTLARVRSPYVVALYDVQPRERFIALQLCRGGNLRLALRRGLLGPEDVERVGLQLRAALDAVHAAGAVHRDVKPANILVRAPRRGSPVALADFGLATGAQGSKGGARGGTLRYLAPELRASATAKASPQTDRYAAAVVLLELARSPAPLPEEFDRLEGPRDPGAHIPEHLSPPWRERLARLLARDPESRAW